MPLFYSSTNGLASRNTRVDALCHALCEVVERDASALAMASSHVRHAVAAILSDIGFGGGYRAQRGAADLVSGLPRPAATLVRKLQRAGLEVQLQNLNSGTGIATIGCTIAEPQGLPIVMNAHSGCGTHPDARIALTRALTEAAQTRLTCIQGGREDPPDLARTSGAAAGRDAVQWWP
jgi:ribosomal protein S12 methylthiotransferase accessory factor